MELISLRQDFPVEWQRYRDEGEDLELQLTDRLFPYMFRAMVKPERAAIVWKGQSRPLVLPPPAAAGLPKYVVGNGENLELEAAHDPYLIVTYKV